MSAVTETPDDNNRATQETPSDEEDQRSISAVEQEEKRLQQAVRRSTKKVDNPTYKLPAEQRVIIPTPARLPFGTKVGAAEQYIILPLSMAGVDIPSNTPHWRIELHGLASGAPALGVDIVGDTVIGRNADNLLSADLDLSPYGALERGVSRRHALLRPTQNSLYLLDLGSTNGTMHNAVPLGAGVTRALKHNDTLTFGRITCTIKIIDGPGLHKRPEEPPPSAKSAPSDSPATRPLNRQGGGQAGGGDKTPDVR